MKKKLIIVLSLFVVLALALTLFACGGKHYHDYSERYVGNDSQHWRECMNDGCPEPKIDVGEHSDTNKDGECDVCGYAVAVEVSGVDLSETTISLKEGETYRLTATVKPADATTNEDVKWTSENDSVASVNQNGTVEARNVGSTRIRAAVGKWDAYCTVYVDRATVKVESVTLTAEQVMGVGDTCRLVPTIEPQNAYNNNVSFKSDDPEIASVDGSGNVTANKTGTANITVTTEDGNKTATCKITVVIPVESVSIDGGSSLTLNVGDERTLTATVLPAEAAVKTVKWRIVENTQDAVTLSEDGELEAVGGGTAVLEVYSVVGNKTARLTVTVNVPVTSVSLDETAISVDFRDTTKILTPTVYPLNATNKNVTFESSDENILTVDHNGRITPVAKGTAKVTVTTEDGEYEAACDVTVVASVSGVSVEKSVTVGYGGTVQLHAVISPADADNKTVTWSVKEGDEDKGITVDDNGLVTASDDAEGPVIIVVTTEDGGYTAQCTVNIGTPVANIKIYNSGYEINDSVEYIFYDYGAYKLAPYQIRPVINPYDADDQEITWELSNEFVIDLVDEGNGSFTVKPLGTGTSNVTFSAGGVTATCGFIVLDLLSFQSIDDGAAFAVMQVNTDMASTVTVPETHNGTPVTTILDGAFYQKSITAVTIPASVTNIGNDVFWQSNYVSVSYLGTLAQWCNISSLEGMFIRRTSDKTTVQVRSDDDTKWLRLQGTEVDNNTTTTARSVYIPDGADHVAAYALFNSYVTEISLPASVKTIGKSAFNYIGGITITFRGTIGEWCEIEGLGDCMALEYYKRNVIIDGVDYRDLETIVIEDGTTKIAPYAFHSGSAGYNVPYRNTTLKNIVIPTSVTSIGNNSFGTCTAIECVFYKGTPDEWAAVDNRGWFGDQANVYCYSYDMPTQAGHFWHYNTDEETPVVWDEFVDIKVERVELEHRSLMLALGDRIQLKAFVYPENASDKSVVWNITAGKSGATIDWSTGELAINTDYTTTTVEITATSAASRYYTDEIFATCTVTIGTIAEYDRVNNGSGYANEWYVKSCDNNNRPTKLVIASEHQTMGGNQVYEVTEIGSGAFSKLAQLEEVWIPSTVTKISTDLLFRADRTVTIYYDITLEEAREMDLSGFTNGKDADVTRTVYFRNPETGRIDVPMPQED